MHFRLADIAYVFALLATSFGAFGPLGLLAAILVALAWLVVFAKIRIRLVEFLVIIFILGTLAGLLLPATQHNRESGRRAGCQNNLRIVVQALLANATKVGQLPQAIQTQGGNRPFHSWRLSILPRIGQWLSVRSQMVYLAQFCFWKSRSGPFLGASLAT
jgi:hypothetical protein